MAEASGSMKRSIEVDGFDLNRLWDVDVEQGEFSTSD